MLSGCSETYWTSNIKEFLSLPANGAIATNADIRLVHRFRGHEVALAFDDQGRPILDQAGKPTLRRYSRDYLCAEPSTDVARAVQAGLSISAAAGGTATPPAGGTQIEAQMAAQINASRAESVAQLTKRISTIQLLRDSLYRACEAYANGAIGQEIYTAIISRYDRMMITMLLGEMAAGNFGSAAVLGGSSSAEASADASAGANGRVTIATRERQEAEQKVDDQLISISAQQRKAKDARQAADGPPPNPALEGAAKFEEAQLAIENDKLALRKAQVTKAETAETQAKAAAQNAADMASARGRTSASGTGSIQQASSGPAAVKDVAEVLARMQRSYLNDPPLQSMVMMCFSELARPEAIQRELRMQCQKIFAMIGKPETQGLVWDTTARPQLREIDSGRVAAASTAMASIMAKLPADTSAADIAKLLQALVPANDAPTVVPRARGAAAGGAPPQTRP